MTDHTTGIDCPACVPSGLTLADLPVGTRVRVPHRGDALGTIDTTPAEGGLAVGIRFDGDRYGLNYPSQCFLVDPPAASAAPELHTIVVTFEVPDGAPSTAADLALIVKLAVIDNGGRLVPCGWAPDPDTIAEQTWVSGDQPWPTVTVHDLNDGPLTA